MQYELALLCRYACAMILKFDSINRGLKPFIPASMANREAA